DRHLAVDDVTGVGDVADVAFVLVRRNPLVLCDERLAEDRGLLRGVRGTVDVLPRQAARPAVVAAGGDFSRVLLVGVVHEGEVVVLGILEMIPRFWETRGVIAR